MSIWFAVAVVLTVVGVLGTWSYGWRRGDLQVLAVIGGAWVGGYAGALAVVAVLVGWWVARLVTRVIHRVRLLVTHP